MSEGKLHITKAIVLGGSHIWRQDPFEALGPRLMLPVANKPLALHTLAWLEQAGIRDITFCVNEHQEALRRLLQDGSGLGFDIRYYIDRTPRGPAGCCRDASQLAPAEHYVVIEGSVLPCVDLLGLLAAHVRANAALSIVVDPPTRDGADRRPSGIYVIARRATERVLRTGYQDIKEILVPALNRAGEVVRAHAAERVSPRISGWPSYLTAQEYLLDALAHDGGRLAGYEARDGAWVHPTARVDESVRTIGWVMIGPNCRVEREAIITGPTVIGSGCALHRRCIVDSSVLWEECAVGDEARLCQCLVSSGLSISPASILEHMIC